MGGVIFSWLGGSDIMNFYDKKEKGLLGKQEEDGYVLGPIERSLKEIAKLDIGVKKIIGLQLLYSYGHQETNNRILQSAYNETNGKKFISKELKEKQEVEPFINWLAATYNVKIETRDVNLPDPTDYGKVYKATFKVVNDVISADYEGQKLVIHQSSGTPAMSTVWVLLNKTKWPAMHLIQTSKFGIKKVTFPFDVTVSTNLYLEHNNHGLKVEGLDSETFQRIKWKSPQMLDALVLTSNIARYDFSVLIEGETGTGKELFAQLIHENSKRKGNNFRVINCGAIPAELLESELFGHEKGAFTGATKKQGLFETADHGTIFLDEIGDLSLELQVKILRVVDRHKQTFRRVGGTEDITVDTRIIAATNRNLAERVAQKKFREDLFRRLAVGYIEIPPLRDRKGDVELLIDHFCDVINHREKEKNKQFVPRILSTRAKEFMKGRSWSGNVRELEFTLERALLMFAQDKKVDYKDVKKAYLPISNDDNIFNRTLNEDCTIKDIQVELYVHYVKRAIKMVGKKKSDIAKFIGVPYATFNKMLKDGTSKVCKCLHKDEITEFLVEKREVIHD